MFKGENCTGIASSKEHTIPKKSIKNIQKLRETSYLNKKLWEKGITCKSCDNELGIYESENTYNLVTATIWKIIVLNINGVIPKKKLNTLLKKRKNSKNMINQSSLKRYYRVKVFNKNFE